MNDIVITLLDSKRDEADEILSSLDVLNDVMRVQTITSRGFAGIGEITLTISALGGGVLLKEVAKIIVAWINRHNSRHVKIGNLDITGYSADEVERILVATGVE